ncbi:MAG: hypothetical protein HOQ18_14000 [Dermatophilaceae bacterium]|nr:hypothetical protein [Dermatophilaceae bacterium]NUO91916.1 hypothetical protein [Dermatophilaceae bacterium]NUR15308.1 hypothetical protein [Dermatophilaceae bacterium]NUR81159.1 hypothetical protein [Dermatophilaceae bacterium]
MSRTPFAPLFDRLVDDAAVFPPGLAPLDVAVRQHLERRTGPYAAQLGPLLVPATAAAELAALAAKDDRAVAEPLEVGLVARPGAPLEPLFDAVELLRDDPRVVVAGAELGWSDGDSGWRRALELEVPVVVEVGLGSDQESGLDDVADAVDHEHDVTAKFRTGATPAWPWPDETSLAGFLDAVVLRGLSFKLTGGLHHAVRGDHDGEPMHGLLNVLLATHEALDGAETRELAAELGRRDTEVLVTAVSGLHDDDVRRLRRSFTAYGCCGVLDPLTELEALGLVPSKETHA